MQDEAANNDVEAAPNLTRMTNEGGYTKQQIFRVDKTALPWKKMPSRTFITRE